MNVIESLKLSPLLTSEKGDLVRNAVKEQSLPTESKVKSKVSPGGKA